MSLTGVRRELRRAGNPTRAAVSQRFFKTDPGEYGAGDQFMGLTVPQVRQLAKTYRGLSLADTRQLLRSPIHEERLLALIILVEKYRRADAAGQRRIYDLYLRSTRYINNWDLVDTSAEHIVGAWCSSGSVSRSLLGRAPRRGAATLRHLAKSASLWERRIAILATFHFIKRGKFAPTLRIARLLLRDQEDLIHKAAGWMLREVGNRDLPALEGFLLKHCREMPRTMLRYAIERLPERKRRQFLEGRAPARPRSHGAAGAAPSSIGRQ